MQLTNKLMLVAGGGFVACLGMAQLFKWQVSKQIHGSSVFQEAMDLLREHRGAKYLLGYPISDSAASFAGLGSRFGDNSAIKVKVTGPKSDGILFITAIPNEEKKMQLDTVQLQVGKDDGKRLVIKKPLNETSSPSQSSS